MHYNIAGVRERAHEDIPQPQTRDVVGKKQKLTKKAMIAAASVAGTLAGSFGEDRDREPHL